MSGLWSNEKLCGLVGEKEIEILATYTDDSVPNAQCVLFRYKHKPDIFALRWAIGSIIELGTDDIDLAKGSIDAMMEAESSDDNMGEVSL